MHERSTPPLLPAAALAALLPALLVTGTALTRAQAPDPGPPAPDIAAQEAMDEAGEPARAAADGTATEQAPGPLEDYEASEQISEDLSVSFPVDI